MNQGKGTDDFTSYIRNLQLCLHSFSVGSQLGGAEGGRVRGAIIHNPYETTIAEMGICRFRSAARIGSSSGR